MVSGEYTTGKVSITWEGERVSRDNQYAELTGEASFRVLDPTQLHALELSGTMLDEIDTEEGYIYDTDTMLCVLAVALERDMPLSIEWYSDGSVFWLFHDLAHVWNDVTAYEEDSTWTAEIYVDGMSEDNANIEGARLAMANGLTLYDVVREIADVEKEYKERFGFDSRALEAILA